MQRLAALRQDRLHIEPALRRLAAEADDERAVDIAVGEEAGEHLQRMFGIRGRLPAAVMII